MPTIPSALLWQCVRTHNAFLTVNRNGTKFSSEPGNLTNLHTHTDSGLVHAKTADVSPTASGVTLALTKAGGKTSKVVLAKGARRDVRKAYNAVKSHRKGMAVKAAKRVNAIAKVQKREKAGVKYDDQSRRTLAKK